MRFDEKLLQGKDTPDLRNQMFIAPKAQGFLLFRVMIYCIISATVTASSIWISSEILSTAGWFTWFIAPVFGMLSAVPFILYNAAKATNFLVGPFARVQRAVRQLANADEATPIVQRDGDCWHEWVQDFNYMMTRVQMRLPKNPSDQVQVVLERGEQA